VDFSKVEHDSLNYIGLSGSGSSTLPIQTLPLNRKNKKWKKANMDALETIGLKQIRENLKFAAYDRMRKGEFTYAAVGLEDDFSLPWFDKEVKKLRTEKGIPTYLKHFDFMGIVVNALAGMYSVLEYSPIFLHRYHYI